jgi:hypothetical protein
MTNLAIQYDFFEDPRDSEISVLRKQMTEVKSSSDKVRKAMFARNGELTKRMLELEYRLEAIERGICLKQ